MVVKARGVAAAAGRSLTRRCWPSNAMPSSEECTSAERDSDRVRHQEVTDGLIRHPLAGGTKPPISALKQILGWKGVTELSD